ncbi:alpha/beta fold hydrolase [Lacihabitans lacunae]|uniref:Alpha/beta fold hydrolase n=1 Tax=Lacihabitans lacunae TaxID=1028214 RepID=A0ABV7YVR2_9BACT
MPFLDLKNANYYYETHGSGSTTFVLTHCLLWNSFMFKDLVEYYKNKYKVIIFDFPGHGKSVSKTGKYDMETLTEDTIEIIETLTDTNVILLGVAMGGNVCLRVAARMPEKVEKMFILGTSIMEETPEDKLRFKMLNNLARTVGFWPVEKNIMDMMFGKTFLENKERKADYDYFLKKLRENDRFSIVKATEGLIMREPIPEDLKKITCKTLVIAGDEDKTSPIAISQELADDLAHGELVVLEKTGLSGILESPDKYIHEIDMFLEA